MKRINQLLLAGWGLMLMLTSCGKSSDFTVKGTLGTTKGEKFIVVYDDPIAKIDTITPIEGEFEYTFVPDTMTLLRLVNKEGKVIPIFADKGWEVNCKGTFDDPELDGEAHNKDYSDFLKSIKQVENIDSITSIAEKFIRNNPQSFASAYLINEYFIQKNNPNIEKVKSLITPLNGEVKDSRVLNVALKSIPTEKEQDNGSLGYFSLKDRDGKHISMGIKDGGFMLINFWASWQKKSRDMCDSLYNLVKKFPKERVKVFNISLDYNKQQWVNYCKKDTTFWTEICNFEGWETPIVKRNNILSLPSNMLIDNQRKIRARNIYGQELTDSLKIEKGKIEKGKK